MIGAQRVEFLLYGLAAHLAESSGHSNRMFRDLDPDKFLRGDVENLKATLGRLVSEFGDNLLITTEDLWDFVEKRNLIVHNYWRLARAKIQNGPRLAEPERFLEEFSEQCSHWERVLRGLLALMRREQGRQSGEEIRLDEHEMAWAAEYERTVAIHLGRKARGGTS